jgi:pyruvate,orthophosphate dikinase
MAKRDAPLDSEALRANIAGTAHVVEVPERYAPLLRDVQDLRGVREPLRELLEEYFHPYRNVDAVIDGLQMLLLRNWSYFERGPARADNFALTSELVLRLAEDPLDDERLSQLLRLVLTWTAAVAEGPHGPDHFGPLAAIGEALAALLPDRPEPFLERDRLAARVLEQLEQRGVDDEVSGPWMELYVSVLRAGYARIARRLDVGAWLASGEAAVKDRRRAEELFSPIGLNRLLYLSASLPQTAEVLSYPSYSELLDDAVSAIHRVEDLEDRFNLCLFFLKDDTLGHRQHSAVVELLAVVKAMMAPERHTDFDRVLRNLTSFFHRREGLYPEMRYQCYQAIGEAIGAAEATRAADHLIDDLLSWRFQYADIRGATEEWQTLANPYHLPNIRCWLRIIESNPALYDRLAAALDAQLRVGGVFVADTDLFQRDVTRLLNSDIGAVYFVVKQLLRTFPVYFNEVGAEGELRSVSTEIDELTERQDTLMHFLRKQVHAESSNRLIDFSEAVLEYWRTLDPAPLNSFLAPATLEQVSGQRHFAAGPHAVLNGASRRAPASTGSPTHGGLDERRVELIVRLRDLLREKYSFSSEDLGERVQAFNALDGDTRARFAAALADRDDTGADRDTLLDAALDVLDELKAIIISPEHTEGVENIYHKRHIAAGIPSMYGDYTEPKFDALGLSFRVEALVGRLLEEAATEGVDAYVTRASLRRTAGILRRFERALKIDGVHSQGLSANLDLLEASFARPTFAFRQYHNIFRFLARAVSDLARISVLSHDQALRTILRSDQRQCERRGLPADAVAEAVLREVLTSALGLQTLDRFVSGRLRHISALARRLRSGDLNRMMNYDPDHLVSWIHEPDHELDDQIALGYKALGLKHLAEFGHRVPEGFILTTELFAAMPAMSYQPLFDDTVERVRTAIRRLEAQTGLVLGDPERPLTLSIRSGAAISMPGLMMTFINVGLNVAVVEAIATDNTRAWSAWDSYRRFLQSWSMAAGIPRDVFDDVMAAAKGRYGVASKAELTADQMRVVALGYREAATDAGVLFLDDPFRQVIACIQQVTTSWESARARTYRDYLDVAEEWGTAVIVQRMVFGNIDERSGSGVVFTRNPLEPHSHQVRLFGDYSVRSQGEDLVGGLVFPLPVSEAQRRGSATYLDVHASLEKDFPEIYAGLIEVSRDLVVARDYDHQELEFTFESDSGSDLYLLQKRPMVHGVAEEPPMFDMLNCERCDLPVAVGMGVAGGAFAGRIATNADQIDLLLREDASTPILLLRPDTVPEDLEMILRVEGILTARGGATSHAAVTAKRLGKTAIVDCRSLEVFEAEGRAEIAGRALQAGDWLSIDGTTGRIFMGRLDIVQGDRPALSVDDAEVGPTTSRDTSTAHAQEEH